MTQKKAIEELRATQKEHLGVAARIVDIQGKHVESSGRLLDLVEKHAEKTQQMSEVQKLMIVAIQRLQNFYIWGMLSLLALFLNKEISSTLFIGVQFFKRIWVSLSESWQTTFFQSFIVVVIFLAGRWSRKK